MIFLSRTQIIIALGAVGLALFVLNLVRRRRLSEEYSVLWVVCTVSLAVLGFSTPLLLWVTRLLGIVEPPSTIFAVGIAFVLAMLLYQSVKISRLGQVNDVLARELALMRYEVDRLRDGTASRET